MTSQVDLDECYNVAITLARKAGEVIRDAFKEKKTVETKLSQVDLVTETDKNVEVLLKKGFKDHFPDHCFIGEESTEKCEFTDAPTWIIDPVDGTMNFVHSFPYSAVSIGFTIKKEVVLGVVYNPVLDKLYTGAKGKGAFCNGKKLQVSDAKELSKSLIICEAGSSRSPEVLDHVFANIQTTILKSHGLRMMGSAALNMCAVASGEVEAYYEYTLHCWDMAGAKIIVEEAGGVVVDPEGKPFDLMGRRLISACCPEIVESLSKELKHIQMPHD